MGQDSGTSCLRCHIDKGTLEWDIGAELFGHTSETSAWISPLILSTVIGQYNGTGQGDIVAELVFPGHRPHCSMGTRWQGLGFMRLHPSA